MISDIQLLPPYYTIIDILFRVRLSFIPCIIYVLLAPHSFHHAVATVAWFGAAFCLFKTQHSCRMLESSFSQFNSSLIS